MTQAMPNPNHLKNREEIDILEQYAGDSASIFRWCERGHIKSTPLGDNKYKEVYLQIRLIGYPSDTAKIAINLIHSSGSGSTATRHDFNLGSVELNNPLGQSFINLKIKAAVLLFDSRLSTEILAEKAPGMLT